MRPWRQRYVANTLAVLLEQADMQQIESVPRGRDTTIIAKSEEASAGTNMISSLYYMIACIHSRGWLRLVVIIGSAGAVVVAMVPLQQESPVCCRALNLQG